MNPLSREVDQWLNVLQPTQTPSSYRIPPDALVELGYWLKLPHTHSLLTSLKQAQVPLTNRRLIWLLRV